MRRLLGLFAFIILLLSCQESHSQPPRPATAVVVASTNTLPNPPPTAAPTAVPVPPSEPTPSRQPTVAATPVLVAEPCGERLPIVLPQPPITFDWQQPPITFDWQQPPLSAEIIPRDVLPALEQFFAQPGDVSLVAYQLGYEGIGFYHNADRPMPLASVSKLLQLVAYGNAVAAGEIDRNETVALADLERFYLPRSDLGAHNRALRELDQAALTVDDVVTMMIRYSANSAADYLHTLLGQRAVEQVAIDAGMTGQSAVCSWIGRFLTMGNQTRTTSSAAAIAQLATEPSRYAHEVVWLTDQYTTDADFRQSAQRYWSTRQTSFTAQQAFVSILETRGTARDYANLMAQIVSGQRGSDLVRAHLAWPMAQFASNQARYATLGYKNGTFPGVLTTVYYAEPFWADTPVVVALFFQNLPIRTYQQWRRDFPHDDMAHWLMSNPNAIHIMHVLRDSAESR